jgi:hypothetical protein
MINRCYFDFDECLVSTIIYNTGDEEFSFDYGFRIGKQTYHTKINPFAWSVLQFARNLIGPENVWGITTSTREYCERINSIALLKFPENQILAREDIEAIMGQIQYDPEYNNPHKHENNVLIDDLPPQRNEAKIIIGGITINNYCKVKAFYGLHDEDFKKEVQGFLTKRHKNV